MNVLDTPSERLTSWIEKSHGRWNELLGHTDENDPRRFPFGYWWVAFFIDPIDIPLLHHLDKSLSMRAPKYSGWPPFTYGNNPDSKPYRKDGCIEAWLAIKEIPEFADFWRVSKSGEAFLLRPMQEDHGNYFQRMKPELRGKLFDWTLPIYRATEIFKLLEFLADEFSGEDSAFEISIFYNGVQNRELVQHTYKYFLDGGRTCNDNTAQSAITGTIGEIKSDLVEIIYGLLAPIYDTFDMAELPKPLVETVSNDALKNHRR